VSAWNVSVRGTVSYACRAVTPPDASLVQVHAVIRQHAPRTPLVHAYLLMGAGQAGMERAALELQRLQRGVSVRAIGQSLTAMDADPNQLWLRGCVAIESARVPA
jgi:hypothetical protein